MCFLVVDMVMVEMVMELRLPVVDKTVILIVNMMMVEIEVCLLAVDDTVILEVEWFLVAVVDVVLVTLQFQIVLLLHQSVASLLRMMFRCLESVAFY